MDAHLTTIGSTLDAIARLQASTPSSSKNVYRPFTCAVLNTYKLDVLDYIRDADQIESNLFWYPPLPGGISGNKGDVEVAAEGAAIAPGIAIRLPEPKEFIPPTPMRKNALEAEAKGLIQFDARTLLKAAQRLLENYHPAPRARKHIRSLLKEQSELDKEMQQYETAISRSEALMNKLSNSEQGKEMTASLSSLSIPSQAIDVEIQRLQESIRKEKMEILAIEQMTMELLENRQKKAVQRARPAHQPTPKQTNTTRMTSTRVPPTTPSHSENVTPKVRSPIKTPVTPKARPVGTPQKKIETASAPRSNAVNKVAKAVEKKQQQQQQEDDGDLTIQGPFKEASKVDETGTTSPIRPTEPQSSDELERICENIWSLFGDNLRFVAADREGADYQDTLCILQNLTNGEGHNESQGDISMASSNASQATAATSGSTSSTSGQLDNVEAPTPANIIAAHILYILLTTSSPHVMEFDELKARGESWWTMQGRDALLRLTNSSNEQPIDVNDSGSSLASKAVYSLIAKKLLRLQFRGAKRFISFPAIIG